MATYRVYGIKWDTDGQHVSGLPEVVVVDMDHEVDEEDGTDQVVNQVSDQYGWLIADCDVERVS